MTGRQRLRLGDWVEFEQQRHQVTGFTATSVRLRSDTGHPQVIAVAELLADATFVFSTAAGRPSEATGRLVLDPGALLDGLDEAEQQRVLTLQGHLLEVTTGYQSGDPHQAEPGEPRPDYDPDRTQRQRVQAKAVELGLTSRRVWQLLQAWRELGLWGLVDKRKTRPHNPLARLDPRILDAIQEQSTAERDDNAGSTARFRRRVQNRLDVTHGTGTVVLPPPDTFRRAVALVLDQPPSGPTARRRSAANQPGRTFAVMTAIRPGQVVLLDTTPLDVLAYAPDVDDVIGVELTAGIDVATRSLLAWRMTPLGTKDIDVGLVIADMMVPEPMRPGWPDALRYTMLQLPIDRILSIDQRLAQAAARPVVYPETLVYDHGKPYQADVLKRACQKLGVNRQDARKLKPTDKAQIERLFGTIGRQFSEHVAGYKSYDVAHRGRDVERYARWSITELEEFFAEYVVAVYQRRHHTALHLPGFRDLRMSPNEAYAHAVHLAGYVACPTDPTLYYDLLRLERRRIHPDGVEINHLTYNADILYRYRNARSPYPDGKWPIRYDPRNMLHAYFHDPADGSWHVLRWTHAFDETQPFTDATLREAKRLLASRGRRPADQHQIAAALQDLQNRTDAPESWTHTDRRRQARDAERARTAARDRYRSAPTANETEFPATPTLRVVPNPDDDPFNADFDLSTVRPAEVWNPAAAQPWRQP
jgi:hypothetical protein